MSNGWKHCPCFLVPGCFIFAWLLFLILPGLFGTWHLRASDHLFKLRHMFRGNLHVSPAIVHLDVDNASIRTLGASVETGSRYEKIIRILSDAGVKAIAFDYVFLTATEGMVSATKNSGRVYYPVAIGPDYSPFPDNLLWHPVIPENIGMDRQGVAFATCNELTSVARGVGHITCYPDEDGVYRKFALLIPLKNGFVPSLSLRVVCDYLKVTPDRIAVEPGRSITLCGAEFPDGRKKDIKIPVDEQCRTIINFAGYESASFAHFSLGKIMGIADDQSRFELLRDDIEDGIVIVADISTAKDVCPVPMERVFHRPGLHSNVINSILNSEFVREISVPVALLFDFAVIAILMFIAGRIRSGIRFVVATLVFFAVFLCMYLALFLYGDVIMNGTRTSFGIVLSLIAITIHKYVQEEKQRTFLRARFESYFAPELMDKILASGGILDTREKKKITILFSDIAGFTKWSSTRSPEEIHRTLNEYFAAMTAIVFKNEGTVDKYIGDGLMVFFGDPVEHPDHALRAVRAAVEMQQKARELKTKWASAGGMELKIRIGINTGDAVVGNMGSEKRVDYTAIGANVNLAQRLESNAPVEGILISRSVYDQVRDSVKTKPASMIKAKGFDNEVETFEVII
ncbi:MAG: hypothetical protein A2283_02215 [Lentisphaerae bacterium RIFOXYA12_FULL_48_11]|nr:MAG: hypothetical protein A2283_02215 [Lentisphaerae bacterium RIFOXYA12_FULL_48_11]